MIFHVKFQSAPHFSSEANAHIQSAMNTLNAFQSAPHFSSEANDLHLRCDAHESCFNPRLTSAARRTRTLAQNLKTLRFQSAPHFSSEANANFGTTLKDEAGVSIRASLQQRGERR